MKCVLHIGTEKTGTTLLQDWLYANQSKLSAQKVFLSNILGKTNNRLFPVYFQNELDDWAQENKISSIEEKDLFFQDFEQRLSHEINLARNKHDVFVISSEHLHSRVTSEEEISRIKEYLTNEFSEVTVVCYFRNQVDMAISSFSTELTVGSTTSLEDFLLKDVTPNNYYFNFKAIADNWSNAFGKDHCDFRIYDRTNFLDGDLRRDFISTLGIELETSEFDFSVASRNERLSKLKAAVFAEINSIVPYWDETNGGRCSLNGRLKTSILSLECLNHEALVFSSATKDEISHRFSSSNEDFFSEYFSGKAHKFELQREENEQKQSYSNAEVENIVRNLTRELLPYLSRDFIPTLRDHHVPILLDSDAGYLHEIATKIDSNEIPSLEDALKLMTLANRSRPTSPIAEAKIKEYRNRLEANHATNSASGRANVAVRSLSGRLHNWMNAKLWNRKDH